MRLPLVLVVALLVGCSSSEPATEDPKGCTLPDGKGTCALGASCKVDCNTCVCSATGLECTGSICGDSSTADTQTDTGAEDGESDAASDSSVPETASDAAADSTKADAPAGETASCDDKTCGASQICVVPCCAAPCKPARPFCADVPSKCAGTPGCPCMADSCTGGAACGGIIEGRLQCACF